MPRSGRESIPSGGATDRGPELRRVHFGQASTPPGERRGGVWSRTGPHLGLRRLRGLTGGTGPLPRGCGGVDLKL